MNSWVVDYEVAVVNPFNPVGDKTGQKFEPDRPEWSVNRPSAVTLI